MRTIRFNTVLTAALLPLAAGCAPEPAVPPEPLVEEVVIASGDVPLHADVHTQGESGTVVLLFHQGGGSARGEYAFLVPTLLEAGYAVVAPDLHGGGDRFGEPNRTLEATPEPEEFGYCDAAGQLRAVREWAEQRFPGARLILWGSSYSAALVLREAAADPEGVAAVLAFSPASGDPMAGCRPEEVAGTLTLPALVLRPANEAQIPTVQEQLRVFEEAGHATWVASPGAHGSSMLNPARVEGSVDPTWQAVWTFLEANAPGG